MPSPLDTDYVWIFLLLLFSLPFIFLVTRREHVHQVYESKTNKVDLFSRGSYYYMTIKIQLNNITFTRARRRLDHIITSSQHRINTRHSIHYYAYQMNLRKIERRLNSAHPYRLPLFSNSIRTRVIRFFQTGGGRGVVETISRVSLSFWNE